MNLNCLQRISLFTILFFSFSLSAMETEITVENTVLNVLSHSPIALRQIKILKGVLWTSTVLSAVYAFWGFGKAMSNSNEVDLDGFQKYFIGAPSILLQFFALFTLYNMKNS